MVYIVLENIRSAYNVGNIIRTADAFGFDVIISGYTPSPFSDNKVCKTSLGAENYVKILEFWNIKDCLDFLKKENCLLIGAEITNFSKDLKTFVSNQNFDKNISVVFGNEVEGVTKETLEKLDFVVHIPMNGIKESLNVGQAAAIFMREIFCKIKL